MLPYFAMVDYPCPAYKNPSDYYCEYLSRQALDMEGRCEYNDRQPTKLGFCMCSQQPLTITKIVLLRNITQDLRL
jgi:hypothetical protein